MWAIDPTNLRLRECGPSTILKNIFSLENLSNPAAEVFYMMLAFWRYCPADRKEPVLHYFEQAAKHAMKYEGRFFMEFIRRVIDVPRRSVIDPFHQNPNFADGQ